jgi:hypothetical protein
LGSKAIAIKNGKEFKLSEDPRTYYIFSLKPPQIQEEAKKDLINQLTNNTSNLIYAYCSDVYNNTTSGNYPLTEIENHKKTSYFNFWRVLFFAISKWQNIVFTIIGLFLATFYFFKSYKTEVYFSLIAVYITYIIGTSGISCNQGDRFHLVVFPFVLILIAKFYSDRKKVA